MNQRKWYLCALALVVSCQGAQEVREQLTFLHCLSLVCSIYQEGAHKTAEPSAVATAVKIRFAKSFCLSLTFSALSMIWTMSLRCR